MKINNWIHKYIKGEWYKRNVSAIEKIVVHHSANKQDDKTDQEAIEAVNKYHQSKGWPQISYHFFIPKSGEIYQMNDLTDITWTDGVNNNSVAICLDGYFHPDINDKPSTEQLTSLKWLLDELCNNHPEFPADHDDVIGHREVMSTACPGDLLYPYVKEYRERLGDVHWIETEVKFDFFSDERIITIIPDVGSNVRKSPEVNKSNILGTLPMNEQVLVSGYVIADTVNGNSYWWKTKNSGFYIWSGSTNVIPTNGFKTEIEVGNEIPESIVPNENKTKSELIAELEASNKSYVTLIKDLKTYLERINTLEARLQQVKVDDDKLRENLNDLQLIRNINETLLEKVEAYKIQNKRIMDDMKNAKAKAFEGFSFRYFEEKTLSFKERVMFVLDVLKLLKNKANNSIVFAWKIGAKLYKVEQD